MIRVKILAENRAKRRGILAEHGLSMLIECDGYKLLLDAGQTNVFSLNAETDGISLSEVDTLVLSHGHYDHTGGVPEFCRNNEKAKIYIHPGSFIERFNTIGGKPSGPCIGIPWRSEKDALTSRMVFVKDHIKVNSRITVSGEIPREAGMSHTGFLKINENGDYEEDAVSDEQFVIIEGEDGVYLFLGCCHPGILNCVEYAKKLTGGSPIRGIIGGLHLEKHSTPQLDTIISVLKSAGVTKLIPLHCTGILPFCHMRTVFGEDCILLGCGDEFIIGA